MASSIDDLYEGTEVHEGTRAGGRGRRKRGGSPIISRRLESSVGSRPRVPLIPLYHGIRVFSEKLGGIRVLWYKGFSAARSAANFFGNCYQVD